VTSARQQAQEERKLGELERLGPDGMDYLVLGVDAPGFDDLPRPLRLLAWWLYRAAIAGDRIGTRQCHRFALEIQELMERIHLHGSGLDPEARVAVHDYLKYLWIGHGQYDPDNHTKVTPRMLTPGLLAAAARHAAARGADLRSAPGESLDAKLSRLAPHIFDADTDPIQTNQNREDDIIATSAVDLYERGITSEEIERLAPEWRERLNVRFARRNGRIEPEVYRIGGLYGDDLEVVSFFLRQARACAESGAQGEGLDALLRFYETGDEEEYRRHCVHWIKSPTTVDYINGFIEQYNDPRGVIGQFEANVNFTAESTLLRRLADSALYFEQRMPWPDKYKRTKMDAPVARVVNVICGTGDAGPSSPAAYNLPNYADLRERHGSKNTVLSNIESARSPRVQEALYREFYLPQFHDTILRWFDESRRWTVYMHEVIGHGSGQAEPELSADPRSLIGRAYSSLEECRSDLVALYHVFDERLVEIGAFSQADRVEIIRACYIGYLQGHMARYRSIPEDTVREAHRRGGELILQYLVKGGGASGQAGGRDFGVRIVRDTGHYFVDLTDVVKARAGVGELLALLQTMKSQGDERGATALFEQFGTHLDPDIRRDIVARAARLGIPRATAFVFPRLEPIIEAGRVVDARLRCDEDLTAQQLRIARWRFSRGMIPPAP